MTTIAAIVPTYNRSALLAECLRSLLAQTRPLDDILVVDDGSADDTAAVVAAFGPPVRYVRQDNGGKSAASNTGLRLTRSDYVWICDDDDLALPHAAEDLAGALDRNPDAGLSYGRFLEIEQTGSGYRDPVPPKKWPSHPEGNELWLTLENFFIYQFASMVRRSSYGQGDPFDVTLVRAMDHDTLIQVLRRVSAVFVDRPMFLLRKHSGARGNTQDRFDPSQTIAKWVHYGQIIYKRVRAELSLDEYLPKALAGLPPPVRTRCGLLQRAAVTAGRHMWTEAFDDVAACIALGGDASAAELAIAERFLQGHFGCTDIVLQPGLARRLGEICRVTDRGRTIAAAMAKPLLFKAREAVQLGQARLAPGYVLAIYRIAGFAGLVHAVRTSNVLRFRQPRHTAMTGIAGLPRP